MKISEFAERNQVTAKLLRHYDELGLLKPAEIDPENGYRSYSEEQSHRLNWILILKNLEFSLSEIKALLDGPVDSQQLIQELLHKRIRMADAMNAQIIKRIQIDRLIHLINQEGFSMNQVIDLMSLTKEGIHEIKKYMPNTEMFVEAVESIVNSLGADELFGMLRLDLCQFKAVNDRDGYDVGDKVIVAAYKAMQEGLAEGMSIHTIGRAGGDEFLMAFKYSKNTPEAIQKVADRIVANMDAVDYQALGCHKKIACYVGGLFVGSESVEVGAIRSLMDHSIELLAEARHQGSNGIVIKSV